MKGSTCLAIIASIAPLAEGINLLKRDNPAVVHAPIQRKAVKNPAQRDRLRRLRKRGTISETLTNDLTLYYANVTLGTPAQYLELHIDTGSSDMWANAPNSTLCEEYASECDLTGVYTATNSSSYAYVNSDFNITYADGSGAAGIYATDDLVIGGTTLDTIQFGIGYESTSAEGILGIGYVTNEAEVEYGKTYPNVPKVMQNRGLINSEAYSLWLNDLDSSTGSILFGGVNTAKYTGSLQTVPIIEVYGEYSEFIIVLTAVGINGDNTSLASGDEIEVLLDSGTSLTYLPDAIVEDLYKKYDAVYDSDLGAAIIDCSMADSTDTIDYTFTSPVISVAMRELVLVAGEENGEDVCIFGIASASDDTCILGDTFLRSAYVVYDLSNNEISLAQTNYNATGDDVQEITDSTSGVPDATYVTSAVTALSSSVETGTSTATTTSDSTSEGVVTSPKMSFVALIGAGLAVSFFL